MFCVQNTILSPLFERHDPAMPPRRDPPARPTECMFNSEGCVEYLFKKQRELQFIAIHRIFY